MAPLHVDTHLYLFQPSHGWHVLLCSCLTTAARRQRQQLGRQELRTAGQQIGFQGTGQGRHQAATLTVSVARSIPHRGSLPAS